MKIIDTSADSIDFLQSKYLLGDIRFDDPEYNDMDAINLYPYPSEIIGNKEFSKCNQHTLAVEFEKIRDSIQVIVEIGVCRISHIQSYEHTSTSVILSNKRKNTIYLGIDIDERSFLENQEQTVYVLQSKSEDYDIVKKKFEDLGIDKIDFLFVDGWHSINQVLSELWYLEFMKSGGVVGYHDTNYHPGPSRIIEAFNPEVLQVTKHCTLEDDWGIAFAKLI